MEVIARLDSSVIADTFQLTIAITIVELFLPFYLHLELSPSPFLE